MTTLALSPSVHAQLKRSSRRRSIGIKVHRGEVIVSAPVQTPLQDIQRFVQKKSQWIQKHLQRQQDALDVKHTKQYEQGDSFLYLGNPIILGEKSDSLASTTDFIIDLPKLSYQLGLEERKNLVEKWYVDRAADYIYKKVEMYAAIMRVKPQSIKIRYYKSRWGSCNNRGQLQFNWTIIMAPTEVVDYVIVHELAHLKHFNHSPAFWRVVESVIPNHKQHRTWLKNQTELVW